MAAPLSQRHCRACEGGVPPLPESAARAMLGELKGWALAPGGKALRQDLLMKDFLAAVSFIQAVAQVAEAEDHHPDLHLTGFRRLAIELSTHAVGGLTENDFILAAKIDSLPRELK